MSSCVHIMYGCLTVRWQSQQVYHPVSDRERLLAPAGSPSSALPPLLPTASRGKCHPPAPQLPSSPCARGSATGVTLRMGASCACLSVEQGLKYAGSVQGGTANGRESLPLA